MNDPCIANESAEIFSLQRRWGGDQCLSGSAVEGAQAPKFCLGIKGKDAANIAFQAWHLPPSDRQQLFDCP